MTDANADATLPDGTDLGLATHERLDARLDALERSRALATTNGDGAMARLYERRAEAVREELVRRQADRETTDDLDARRTEFTDGGDS